MTPEETRAHDEAAAGPGPLVLVLVGTDHHRFDRVVTWVDAWARRNPTVRVLVQHGTADAPRVAHGRVMLPHDELVGLVAEASVVVSHGGPATISDVRGSGRRPLVVPRDPALGEHVDAHQQRFARRMGAAGLVVLCENEQELSQALNRALSDPAWLSLPADEERARVGRTVAAIAAVVDELTRTTGAGGRSRRSWRRRGVTAPPTP